MLQIEITSHEKPRRICHMDAVAIRKSGVEGCEPFKYGAVGDDSVITGGIPKVLTRGPRKGRKTWDGCKESPVVVTRVEQADEEARYVAETGNCGKCYGEKQTFASWDHIEGTKYRECRKCAGTGKATGVTV
jgi:hypothetical protein